MVQTLYLAGCGTKTTPPPLFWHLALCFSSPPLFPSFSSALHTCIHITASEMMLPPALLGMVCICPCWIGRWYVLMVAGYRPDTAERPMSKSVHLIGAWKILRWWILFWKKHNYIFSVLWKRMCSLIFLKFQYFIQMLYMEQLLLDAWDCSKHWGAALDNTDKVSSAVQGFPFFIMSITC